MSREHGAERPITRTTAEARTRGVFLARAMARLKRNVDAFAETTPVSVNVVRCPTPRRVIVRQAPAPTRLNPRAGTITRPASGLSQTRTLTALASPMFFTDSR